MCCSAGDDPPDLLDGERPQDYELVDLVDELGSESPPVARLRMLSQPKPR